MAKGFLEELLDGILMESMGKVSLSDLPDIVLVLVIELLDLPSQFKLRVDRRFNHLQLSANNHLEKIELTIATVSSDALVVTPSSEPVPLVSPSQDTDAIASSLQRLALNTRVCKIELNVGNEAQPNASVVHALFQFEADELEIRRHSSSRRHWRYLPETDLSTFLALAQKVRRISIGRHISSSLTVRELCVIRKTMLEGKCKLESFSIEEHPAVPPSFLHKCFGVRIRDARDWSKYPEKCYMKRFLAEKESVELYASGFNSSSTLCHFEGDLKTTIRDRSICFEKCNGGAKPESNFEKVNMNCPYEYKEGDY